MNNILDKPDLTSIVGIPTIIEMLYYWEQNRPDAVFLRQPKGKKWQEFSWRQTGDQVRRMAHVLKSFDLPPGSNISIISKNCAHWIIADLAIMMSGHVSVPLYPNLTAEQLNHVLKHSECKVLFSGKLDDWGAQKPGVPKEVIGVAMPLSNDEDYLQWEVLLEQFQPLKENFIPNPLDLSAILYTSGTTGSPKGVMFNHKMYQLCVLEATKVVNLLNESHRFFSYLPLCHVAERNVVEICGLYSGGEISFVDSIDTFITNLQQTQPTVFFAVPRIWTKFQLGVLSKIPQKKLDILFKIPLISKLIKQKIRKGLGLNKARHVITAAAPCPAALHHWYHKLGLQLQELYGMTENGGVCTIMRKEHNKIGTVGQAYPDCDIRIDPETSEIQMKAEWNMLGYYKEPEMTAEVLKDGYLHTGDMGNIDDEGFLSITGRVKDTFKTAKGEYVVPGPIEWGFALNNSVEQICVLGRSLPQPVALVVLSDLGKTLSESELVKDIKETVDDINRKLVNYERIFKTIIVKESWSPENGILTPTLKVRRNVLENIYSERLHHWYELPEMVIWE